MKQGRAMHDGPSGSKTEPMSKAVSVGAVSRMGLSQGTHATDHSEMRPQSTVLYEGRGLQAPKATCKTSNCGSQGSY